MKDKKIGSILFVIIFFLICLFPLIGMLVYEEPENTENKALVVAPEFIKENHINIYFLKEYSEFFCEHFAGRQELVTANALIQGKVFKVSSEDIVIVGKDGWLFYENSLNDYLGINTASERGIHNIGTTLSLVDEYVKNQGKTFIFTVAPNKNSLYPEYMPYNYVKASDNNNLTKLEKEIEKNNITYIDLKNIFLTQEEILYHKGDSHWNNKGAALAHNYLMKATNYSYTDFSQEEYVINSKFQGDLDKILYQLARHEEKEYEYSFSYNYLTEIKDTSDFIINTVNEEKEGSLVMFRDSFGNTLLPFMAEEYGNGYFSRCIPYRIDYVKTNNADTCIIEIVERNLNTFQKSAPIMPAPRRDIGKADFSYTSSITSFESSNFENYTKINGVLDELCMDVDSEIYIRIVNDNQIYTYEAFPVYEKDITKVTCDYGYVAYLDNINIQSGKYEVEVITRKDGKLMTTGNVGNITIE